MLQIWQSILDCLEDNRRALSDLWGGHLRFFRQLVRQPRMTCPWDKCFLPDSKTRV